MKISPANFFRDPQRAGFLEKSTVGGGPARNSTQIIYRKIFFANIRLRTPSHIKHGRWVYEGVHVGRKYLGQH